MSRPDQRLSPWSAFKVADLVDDAAGIVGAWASHLAELGEEARPGELTDRLSSMLEGVGRWLVSGEAEIPDDLRAAFRDLAFAYRSHGRRLDQTLRDLELLEDLLVGDDAPDADGEMATHRALRRAMRTLWTETIQLNDALSQRRDRERIDALQNFEEILSHELGNRLGAARTGVDILQDAPDELSEDRRKNLLELIGDGIDAALRTVDDVGAFLQAQRWSEDLHQPLREVAAGVVKGLGPQARSQGVSLEVDPDQLPDAEVDAGRLRLVLSNFLVNGIRYADPDKDERWVRLAAERRDGELHVSVADNGIGIPEEEQGEVFAFHRRGRNHGREGSGMGLTIAAEAVSQLGGRIELESEPGRGTTLRVALPLEA